MQTLEQVLRQYALNPLVQTKIEIFAGSLKAAELQTTFGDQCAAEARQDCNGLTQEQRDELLRVGLQKIEEGRKPEVSPCASPSTTPDPVNEKVGSCACASQAMTPTTDNSSVARFICFRCDEEHDMQDAHTTLNGPLCTNCVNAASLEAAAVLRTAESSLSPDTSVAHTPAVIGKLNISNPT